MVAMRQFRWLLVRLLAVRSAGPEQRRQAGKQDFAPLHQRGGVTLWGVGGELGDDDAYRGVGAVAGVSLGPGCAT